MEWAKLKKYHLIKPSDFTEHIPRLPKVQKEYDENLEILKKAGSSIDKVILKMLFSGDNIDKRVLITVNKYPYDVAKGIHHYIAWVNPVSGAELIDVVEEIEKLTDKYIMFMKPIETNSVILVPHYHIFTKKKLNL